MRYSSASAGRPPNVSVQAYTVIVVRRFWPATVILRGWRRNAEPSVPEYPESPTALFMAVTSSFRRYRGHHPSASFLHRPSMVLRDHSKTRRDDGPCKTSHAPLPQTWFLVALPVGRSKRPRAPLRYSSLISTQVHLRRSRSQTSPVTQLPANGSRTVSPSSVSIRTKNSGNAAECRGMRLDARGSRGDLK